MYEIKSSRSEGVTSSMQESRRSVKLADGLSKTFLDELPVDADDLNETPNAGNFFKPSKKVPIRKRTSIRKPTKRLDVNNLDNFMEMESRIDSDSRSLQDDAKARSQAEPTNVCIPFSGLSPFSIENIDMRTKEGRLLKESIKAQVKKITVIKRAQNRSEQSILNSMHAMKHGSDVADASVRGDTKSCGIEMPECQSNSFPNVLGKETEHSTINPDETRVSKNSEKEDVVEMTLARRSRKRQWRTNAESEPDMTHVVNKNATSRSIAVLPEDLCEDLADTPRNSREHSTAIKEETHLRKSGMKEQVKKVTFDQNFQKKPAKINISYPLEMNSELGDHTSSMLGNAETQYFAESTKSLRSTFSNALAGSDDHLHDNAEEELLPSGLKEPIIRKTRKRQVKNNMDQPLEINSTEDCSLSMKAGSQRSVQLSESQHSTFADVPEGAAEDLQPSTDEGHMFNAASVGAVKKMALVKKPRTKPEKNNSDHVLEIKSGMGKDSSIIVCGELEPCRTIEPPEGQSHAGIQPITAENLHAIIKEESLLKANERGDFTNSTLVKNARKRPAKNGSDHVHETQREACDDSSLLRRKSLSSSINEPLKGPSVDFSEAQADVSEHLNTNAEEARLINLSEMEEARKASLIKQTRKRPTKSNSNFKTGEGSLFQDGMESRYSVERPEGQCEFTNLSVGDAGHVRSDTQLVKAKGAVQNVPVIRKVRKRPERGIDQMLKIKSKANGKDSSLHEASKPLVDDYGSQRSSGVQERQYSAFSAVPIDTADHLQSTKEEGSLFKPEMQRAVKKMTLSQKPRTGLEKDSDRVLQMKSERVDDSMYSAQSNTVFRYSVELPESLCSGFPSAQQKASEAMDIRTAGGRLCLFAASKNASVKKRAPVKKAILKAEETSLPNPHELQIELGDDASSLVLGESESLSGLDLPENPCSGFPDVPPGASENMNLSADEASFLQESPKVCARNVTLIEEGVEESELDHLFEMKNRSGDDALASVMEDSESRSSFEFPEVHGTIFPDVSPHTADPTELDTEEGNLFNAIVEEKKRPLNKDNGPGPECHFDRVLEVKKEELGSLLQEDSETRLSADVAGNIDMLPNTNVDMNTEGTLLGLFDPDKKVRKRPPSKKQLDGQGKGTFEPLLKKRGRKKKDPEMEILHDGEVRVKQKGRLISKDHEGGVKPRKKGKVSESGFANDGVFAPDGETNLDFGEIFDAVLAEACKWECSKDPEHLARLGLGEGITGTGRLKAPPMSDNDLYSSGDEAEESLFGYSQPYEHNKLTSMKKHRECVQASQVEKRKTSSYFSKRSTEGEHPRDDVMAAGEDTISGYEDASDDLLDPIFTDTDEESEDLDLGNQSGASLNGAGPSGLNSNAPSLEPGEVVQGVDVNCKTVEGAILKTEQKQLCVVKNINDQLRRMERHLANLVKFNRLYIRRSIGLTGELVRENASQSLSLQRIAETLESAIPFPAASGIRLTADTAPTSSSSSVSSDSSDEEWAKRPSKTPKRAKRNREEGAARGRKKK